MAKQWRSPPNQLNRKLKAIHSFAHVCYRLVNCFIQAFHVHLISNRRVFGIDGECERKQNCRKKRSKHVMLRLDMIEGKTSSFELNVRWVAREGELTLWVRCAWCLVLGAWIAKDWRRLFDCFAILFGTFFKTRIVHTC